MTLEESALSSLSKYASSSLSESRQLIRSLRGTAVTLWMAARQAAVLSDRELATPRCQLATRTDWAPGGGIPAMSRSNWSQSSPETISCAVLFPLEQTLGPTNVRDIDHGSDAGTRPGVHTGISGGPRRYCL